MPGIDRWRNLMPYVVTVETCSTMDSYGTRTYQSCASYRCAVQGSARFLHQATHQMLVSRQTIIVGTAAPISLSDRITLPAQFEISQPPIMQVQRVSNGLGLHHTVIYCG